MSKRPQSFSVMAGACLMACTPVPSGEPSTSAGKDANHHDSGGDSGGQDSSGTTDSSPPSDSGDSGDSASAIWRSALYPNDWTPDFTFADGHFLHDFSYAGYHAGEADIPSAPGPHFDVVTYGADPTGAADSTAGISAAIAAAGAAAPAVVEFPAGTFRLDGSIAVTHADVVLQGQGSGVTRLYFTSLSGLSDGAHITFRGKITDGADYPLVVDGVSRSRGVEIAPNSALKVGDAVSVGWTITDAFIDEHAMTGVWVSFNGEYRRFFRRTVTAIDTTTGAVTLDVPLRTSAKVRDGASLRIDTGYLSECGIEHLSVSDVNDWDAAWAETRNHAILFSGVQDCWARDITSWESPLSVDGRGRHLASGGIEILDSRRVTVADSTLEKPQNRGDGGNGYLFEVSRSNEILFRDDHANRGRHNFIQNWDFGTSGCVWLRTTSEGGRAYSSEADAAGYASYSEFHHSLAMANLIDASVASDGWQGVNRQAESSGAGHSVTESVWWNISGGGYLRSLQFGNGYIIGTDQMSIHVDPDEADWNNSGQGTAPTDWTEGVDEAPTLDPPSLYEDQLRRRLAR